MSDYDKILNPNPALQGLIQNQLTREAGQIANANNESTIREQQLEIERLRRQQSAPTFSGGTAILEGQVQHLESQLGKALDEKEAYRQALAERDELLLGWMQSNEAFKRLARKYGQAHGMTDAERTADFHDTVLKLAEEDPKFQVTTLTAQVKAKRGGG